MRNLHRIFILLLLVMFSAFAAKAQDDTPSLGDVARQTRQQKQQKDAQAKPAPSSDASQQKNDGQTKDGQSNDGQAKDATPSALPLKHVITNEEIPSHVGPTSTTPAALRRPNVDYEQQPPYDEAAQRSAAAPSWTSQIQSARQHIEYLKGEIDRISSTIQYAGGNCVSGCAQWNENQKRKQDQVDAMKGQLDQEQQRLEDLQDKCSRQGFGTSVCDP